jgi:uncharacterized protein (TIGR03437 family)
MRLSYRLVAAASLCALSAFGQARLLLNMPPADGSGTTVNVYTQDPFNNIGTFQADRTAFFALINPLAPVGRMYIMSREGSEAIQVVETTAPFNTLRRLPTGSGVTGATYSPDGRFLMVVAGNTLRVFDTGVTPESPQFTLQVANGARDIVASHLSNRVFVLSRDSGIVTWADIGNLATTGQLSIGGPCTGISVAPSGIIYVSAPSRIWEIDPRGASPTLISAEGFTWTGRPTTLAFTPDGTRGIFGNQDGLGGRGFYLADLANRRVVEPTGGPALSLERVSVLTNNYAVGLSSSDGALYGAQLNDLANTQIVNVPNFALINRGNTYATSGEQQYSRFLFVGAGTDFARVLTDNGSVAGRASQTNTPGPSVALLQTASAGAFNVTLVSQPLAFLGPAAAQPLVVRVTDGSGLPIRGVTVTFTPSENAAVNPASTTTSFEGYASTTLTPPTGPGSNTFVVRVSAENGRANGNFTITPPSAPGTGPIAGPGPIAIVSGDRQLILSDTRAGEDPQVIVRDSAGNPIVGATVNWTPNSAIRVGNGGLASSLTDSRGVATIPLFGSGFIASATEGIRSGVLTAESGGTSVAFNYVIYAASQFAGTNTITANSPFYSVPAPNAPGTRIVLGAGQTLPGAMQIRITNGVTFQFGQSIPGVFIRTEFPVGGSAEGPTAFCVGNPFSDSNGVATCDLRAGGRIGTTPFNIVMGSINEPLGRRFSYELEVTAGAASRMRITNGNNQSGQPGQQLPRGMVVQVTDDFGNPVGNAPITWNITSGAGTLIDANQRTNTNGEASATYRFGGTPGPVTITVRSGNVSATFNHTNNAQVGNFLITSGNSQGAQITRPFPTQLAVRLTDPNNAPIAGVPVAWNVVSGSVTLGTLSSTTNSDGTATNGVTAGTTVGPVVISAAAGGRTVTFNIDVLPEGPTITNIQNAASFETGSISPCSLATLNGLNFLPTLRGTIAPNRFGPQPLSINNVRVLFNGTAAPLFSITNTGTAESINLQVPCEISAGAATLVVETSPGVSASTPVQVRAVSPGIFEFTNSANRRQAVITKTNGSYVAPENPAERGELLTAWVTGLGATSAAQFTNAVGTGQPVIAEVIVGVNNEGMEFRSAAYVPNLIGVYAINFVLNADTATGPDRPFSIVVRSGGSNVPSGNSTTIPIR